MKTILMLCCGAVLWLGTIFQAHAGAGDWPRFRGPDGAGIGEAAGIPLEIGIDNIIWSVDLPGPGHSSPVVRGDRIFLTAGAADDLSRRSVMCFASKDGSRLWQRDYEWVPHSQHKHNNPASSTPCLDSERVYVSWTSGGEREVIALQQKDGHEVWRKTIGKYKETHGSSASPVLAEGVLVIPNDHADGGGAILGLDPKSGKTLWTHQRDAERTSFSTPLLHQGKDGKSQLIFTGCPFGLTAIDPANGKVLWQSADGFDLRTVGSAIHAGDVVFATAGQGGGGVASLAVHPDAGGGNKRETVFKVRKGLPYVPTPVAANGLIFLWTDSGVVQCVRASDGESLWRERVCGPTYASPLVIGERIYGFSKKGEIAVLAAAPEFKKLALTNIGDPIHATPAISAKRMIIRTVSKLIAVGE